jgi:hypothetical protein
VATTGVVGQRWRATVAPDGCVEPRDGTTPLHWYVAADDRWHDPGSDAVVRHGRLAGTAVFETKLRIPGGDVVQRVWSVADKGGYTLVSVHNDSPRPCAVAFTRGDLATSRPPADIPVTGLELPPGSIVLPIGHRAAVTVGLAHAAPRPATLPGGLPADDAVVRGWIARTDVASRLDLPERSLVDAVRAARCELLLGGLDDVAGEPERHLLGLAELVRLGALDRRDAIASAPDVAAAVDEIARRLHPLGRAALAGAGVVLAAAGERRALDDIAAVDAALDADVPGEPASTGAVDDVATIAIVERRLAAGARLFPGGIPAQWLGHDFEAHHLVVAPDSRLSLAVRWHGGNAAVLWDVEGEPLRLSASVGGSRWSVATPRGEALWQLPHG